MKIHYEQSHFKFIKKLKFISEYLLSLVVSIDFVVPKYYFYTLTGDQTFYPKKTWGLGLDQGFNSIHFGIEINNCLKLLRLKSKTYFNIFL